MRRYPALLALALLALLTPGASAGAGGSYHVRVFPDPTGNVLTRSCGTGAMTVGGQAFAIHARELTVPAGSTLTAWITPDANVFAGDVGLNWVLRVYDTHRRQLAEATGPAWHQTLTARKVPSQVLLIACNIRGVPDATITWSASRSRS